VKASGIGSRLKELEKRLASEPANLGLRVTVAGLLHEAGRTPEAIALYRSVALAYRAQGRVQQAIAVCRSALELAPDDACRALLAELAPPPPPPPPAPPAPPPPAPVAVRPPSTKPPTRPPSAKPPARRPSQDTPLPRPLPHHVADPTTRPMRLEIPEEDAPWGDGATTRPSGDARPRGTGLAEAARRISGLIAGEADEPEIDVAAELDTRKRPRVDPRALVHLTIPPVVTPVPPGADEPATDPTRPRDSDEELTAPHDRTDPDD
jgi:hypothetical protein